MRRWIGRWLIGVGVVHNVVGVYSFLPVLREMASAGLWNSTGMDPMRNLVFWFLSFGFVLMILGSVTDWIERQLPGALPSALGWSLLLLMVIGIIVMPASGFWLLIPALYGCLRTRRKTTQSFAVAQAGQAV